MSDLTVFTIHWLSLKYLLMYMHVLDWDDEFFTRWKKLCAELNDCKSLLLWSCFYITTMLNSRISLLIKNDSWILNDFLMLYCRICKKDCSVLKLFIAVVDFAIKKLFVCFQSSMIFLTFWLNVSKSAQMLSRVSHYLCKRKDQFIFSWSLLFIKLIHQFIENMLYTLHAIYIEHNFYADFSFKLERLLKEFSCNRFTI